MEAPKFDTPKPMKVKMSIQDRMLKNPITSIIGVFLVCAGIYVLKLDLSDTMKMTASGLLIGGGLISLGLKDKKDA